MRLSLCFLPEQSSYCRQLELLCFPHGTLFMLTLYIFYQHHRPEAGVPHSISDPYGFLGSFQMAYSKQS
jgi:hypothetical protein